MHLASGNEGRAPDKIRGILYRGELIQQPQLFIRAYALVPKCGGGVDEQCASPVLLSLFANWEMACITRKLSGVAPKPGLRRLDIDS